MSRLLLATTNPGKLREIRTVLAGLPVDLLDLASLPAAPEPEETGATFADNARIKALAYGAHADAVWGSGTVLTVAEDSGLEIDALAGDPGVRSARYLGPHASYPDRFADLARRLQRVPHLPRTARFICALAAVREGRVVFEATGVVAGEMADRPRGTGGFGYDPIFFFPPYGATLAEVSTDDKIRVAHRGQAFRALAAWLRASDTMNGER
jgi:XTP/dITP diphosphohydrolase